MSEKDVRREKEEAYFLRKEMELRERLRQQMEEGARLARLREEFGEADERVLKAFEEAGFSRETVVLLHLIPLIEVAWADGEVTAKERECILDVAGHRDIKPGTKAHGMLLQLLSERPAREVFEAARRAIRFIFAELPEDKRRELKDNLTLASLEVAEASGGFLGLGPKVNAAERAALRRVAEMFAGRQAARDVLDRT